MYLGVLGSLKFHKAPKVSDKNNNESDFRQISPVLVYTFRKQGVI